jgi:hypothetical protein
MPANLEPPQPKFAHRPDADGFVSFCLTCLQNVAKAEYESGLAEGEAMHKCKGDLLPDLKNIGPFSGRR